MTLASKRKGKDACEMKRPSSPIEDPALKKLREILETAKEDSSGTLCVNIDPKDGILTEAGLLTSSEDWFSKHVYSVRKNAAMGGLNGSMSAAEKKLSNLQIKH